MVMIRKENLQNNDYHESIISASTSRNIRVEDKNKNKISNSLSIIRIVSRICGPYIWMVFKRSSAFLVTFPGYLSEENMTMKFWYSIIYTCDMEYKSETD